nr:hypothetical protein [Tanacetum cinerariifolium]
NPQQTLKDKGVIDSGCLRHITENISFLSEFEEFNGGYVAFGGNPKGGKISGKDTKCIVLSSDFKLPNENQVLLRVPRENNMYNVDLKNGKQHRASCKSKHVSSVSHPLERLHMDLLGPTFVKSLNKKSYCLVVIDDYSRFRWVFFLPTKDETSAILTTFITGIENQINHKVKIIRCDNGTELKNHDLNQFCRMKGIKREFSVARTSQQNRVAKRKNRTLIEAARTSLADSLLPIPFWAEAANTAYYVQNRVLVSKPHNKTPYKLLLGKSPSIGFMRPFGCPNTILNTLDPLGKFDGKDDEGFFVRYSVNSKAFSVFNSRTRIVQETLHINFLENQPNVAGSGPKWLFDIDTLTQSMNYQPLIAGNQPNHNAGIKENLDADADDAFDVKHNGNEVHVFPSGSDKTKTNDDKAKRDAKAKSHVSSPIGVGDLRAEFEEFSSNSTNRVNAASAPVTADGPNPTNSTNSFNTASPSDTVVSPNFEIARKSLFVDPSKYPTDPDMPQLEDIVYSDDEEYIGAEADLFNLETNIAVSHILTTRVHKDHLVTQIIGDLTLAPQTRSMARMVKEQGVLNQINDKDFHTCIFACFLSQEEPKKVHQALKEPSWIEAMQEELFQFKMQKVWVLVDLPKGKRAIGSKWVFRNKKDERGIVIRNKARLVAQGHTQEEGIDYDEVFVPVARIEAIWLFLAYASFMGFMVYQMDVKSAFLYETIKEKVYVCQPLGFKDSYYPDKVFKTLFIKKQKGDNLLVQVYVDDIIFRSTNKELCKAFEILMKDKFQMSSMRELTFFLGLQVKQKDDGIFISQDKYIAKLLRKFGFTYVKSASTSVEIEKPLLKDPDGEDVDVHIY